jgi:hypothetical protein
MNFWDHSEALNNGQDGLPPAKPSFTPTYTMNSKGFQEQMDIEAAQDGKKVPARNRISPNLEDCTIEHDDKIVALRIAFDGYYNNNKGKGANKRGGRGGQQEENPDVKGKDVFMIELVTKKGQKHRFGDDKVDEEEIMEVPLKPDEHIVGFFGNIDKHINGFGIFVTKDKIVRRVTLRAAGSGLLGPREVPNVFDENIEGTKQALQEMTFATSDPNWGNGIEMVKFSHFHPKRGILGYNAFGQNLMNNEELAEQGLSFQNTTFSFNKDELIKDVRWFDDGVKVTGLYFATNQGRKFSIGPQTLDFGDSGKSNRAPLGEFDFVCGFFGDFGDSLEGFGLFVGNEQNEYDEEEYNIRVEELIYEPPEEEEIIEEEPSQEASLVPEAIEDIIPELDEEWNQGDFTININHSVILSASLTFLLKDFALHFNRQFDALGEQLKEHFPNVEIIGNHEKPTKLNGFEVYIRGVGPLHRQDDTGRIMLFKNSRAIRGKKKLQKAEASKTKFRFKQIFDNIVDILIAYGDADKMGKAQKKFVHKYAKILPKPWQETVKVTIPGLMDEEGKLVTEEIEIGHHSFPAPELKFLSMYEEAMQGAEGGDGGDGSEEASEGE